MFRFKLLTLPLIILLLTCISWAQAPLSFVPTGPCRVVDTRGAAGIFGGPFLAANTIRDFPLTLDPACAIPNTAQAYALNVTVVPHGALGYITLWPTGQTRPTVSTLNSNDGRVKAVAAIVPAGASADKPISVFTTNNTDLVLDVVGYFVAPGTPGSLYFHPLPEYCELINTSDPPNPSGLAGPALSAGVARSFQVSNTLNCSIPWNAAAYSLNITATPVNGKRLGYITVWPSDQAQPLVSTLNAPTGTTVANAAIVKAGTGAISIYASADTNIEVYLNGYFGPKYGQFTDALYTLPPCRGLDTRPTYFTERMDYTLQAEGGCVWPKLPVIAPEDIPPITAFVLNATLVPNAGVGYFPIWQHDKNMPTPSTLFALDAAITSNMAIVPAPPADGQISSYSSAATNLLYDLFGYFASPDLVILTQPSMVPDMTAHVPFAGMTMQARGGIPPYTWSKIGKFGLPLGLSIDSATGTIAGCPNFSHGSEPLWVRVTDSLGTTHDYNHSVNVAHLDPLTINHPAGFLPDGYHNQWYTLTLGCSGGYAPFNWSIVSGTLPPGLTLGSDGVISGYATNPGTWNFTVQVADNECPNNKTQQATYWITIEN